MFFIKLSLESCVLRSVLGDTDGFKLIKESGFDCVDMSYYVQEGDPILGEGYREYAVELRTYLDALELKCNQAHAPNRVRNAEDFYLTNPNYIAILRAIESASILGAKAIVIHSLISSENGRMFFDRERNINYYKSFQPLCEKLGISVAVENLYFRDLKRQRFSGRLGTPEELCDFVRELNSPCFVACLDIGHTELTGMDAEEFIERADANILKVLHVQDGDYSHDGHTLPFLGKYNWEEIMKALKKINYDGELTFEIINYLKYCPKELLPQAVRLAEKTGRYLISIYDKA